MKKKQWIFVVAGLVILGAGVFWFQRNRVAKVDTSQMNSEEQTAQHDRDTLNDPKADEYLVMGAMIRLAIRHEPELRKRIDASAKHASKVIRAAAGDALGYYNDAEALKLMAELLNDPDESVRVRAAMGLSHLKTKEREEILLKRLDDKTVTPEERMEVSAALVKIGGPASSGAAIGSLIQVVNQGSEAAARDAMVKVVGMGPENPKIIELCRTQARSGKDPQVRSIAIRHLATFDSTWLASMFESLRLDPSPVIRMAAVESLHSACPGSRWKILTAMAHSEKDKQVLESVVKEARMMPGPTAISFLSEVRLNALKEKNQALADLADVTMNQVKVAKFGDHCENSPPTP